MLIFTYNIAQQILHNKTVGINYFTKYNKQIKTGDYIIFNIFINWIMETIVFVHNKKEKFKVIYLDVML